MSDIRIETPDGSYDNEDAYNRVIGYISEDMDFTIARILIILSFNNSN